MSILAPLALGSFVDSTGAAAKLHLETGIPFDEALRQITKEKEEKNTQDAIIRAQTAQLAEAAISKMAKLGTEPRNKMPQVDNIDLVRKSDIPTGYLEFVDPKKLKPIQPGTNEELLKSIYDNWDVAGKKPVLISKDNWIIDGHHRVKAAIKKNKWVRVIRINLPGKKALNAVKELVNE